MAEDELVQNLTSYKIQLEQVEAALSTSPDNEDLLKLKTDLAAVIELTLDLIKKQDKNFGNIHDEVNEGESLSWKVGDKCMAIWSKNGNYYEAIIDEIIDDKHATITFAKYGTKDVAIIKLLKPFIEQSSNQTFMKSGVSHKVHAIEASSLASVDPFSQNSISTADKSRTKREIIKAQQEQKRKKAIKKAARLQNMDMEGETEKQKWKNFNHKALTKIKKGITKKSIFATPDTDLGKVGVGTCGIGGRPMSKPLNMPKYNRQS